jgi:hypothetical protein
LTLPDMLVPTYVQTLTALSAWLGKAEAHGSGTDAEAFLAARLAPDMFPLATQIRFACVQALEGVCRLQGEDFPALHETLLAEGRNAGEQPGSIADARARIEETLGVVGEMASRLSDVAPETPIAHSLPVGIIFDLTAAQYVRDWALPQFYFHILMAYAILRAAGVDLGKADYVAHLFPFVRPGTMPTG